MLALALVSASVLLTACAGPDLDELETDAAAVFDTLVEAAGLPQLDICPEFSRNVSLCRELS